MVPQRHPGRRIYAADQPPTVALRARLPATAVLHTVPTDQIPLPPPLLPPLTAPQGPAVRAIGPRHAMPAQGRAGVWAWRAFLALVAVTTVTLDILAS